MDAEAQDFTQTMMEIERHTLESDARARAASLVSQGIGADVDRQADAFPEGAYVVTVLPADAVRARQVLGLQEPPTDDDELDEAELTRSVRGWLIPVLALAAAFVIIPIAAFYITYKLQGG